MEIIFYNTVRKGDRIGGYYDEERNCPFDAD
jgi:hypothetical protein